MLRHWLKTVKGPALVMEIFTTEQQFILDGVSAWTWQERFNMQLVYRGRPVRILRGSC